MAEFEQIVLHMRNIIYTFYLILFCLFVNDVQGRNISVANFKADPGVVLKSSQVCNGFSYLRAIVADKDTSAKSSYLWLFSKTGDMAGKWEVLSTTKDTTYTADEIEDGKKGYYRVAIEKNGDANNGFISNAVYLEPHDCETPLYHWNSYHYRVLSCEGPWCVWYPVDNDTLRISTTEYYNYNIEILGGASLDGAEAYVSGNGISVCYKLPEPVTGKDSVFVVLSTDGFADTSCIYYDFVKEIYDTTSVTVCYGESYEIGDTVLTTSGVYTVVTKTEAGCDLVITVNFKVMDPITKVTNATICEGESYLWNGKYFDQTGTYLDTLKNSGSCDVYCTLNLKVNNVYHDSVYIEHCEDEKHLVSAITVDSMLTVNGCDSIRITNLKVYPTYFDTTFATIRRGDTYVFNNSEYSETGIYEDAYTTANGCDSIIVLNLKVLFAEIEPMPFFSPNGDGENDVWTIKNIDLYPDAKVVIFDRYGKPLAKFPYYDNLINAWDGTYNGHNMPSTDYWYYVNIESLDKIYTGHFSLIR